VILGEKHVKNLLGLGLNARLSPMSSARFTPYQTADLQQAPSAGKDVMEC